MKRIILQPVYAQILHVVGLVVESWLVINLVKGLVDQGERVGAQLYVQHILMKSIYEDKEVANIELDKETLSK